MLIYVSLLFALVGLVAYVMASNAKIAEVGRITFAMALLAFLLQLGGRAVSLGR